MRKDIVLWKPGRKLTQNSRRRGIKRKRRIRILLKAKLDWTATFSCNARAFVESSFQDPTSRSRVSPLRRIPSGDPVHMKIPSGHPVTIYEQKHGRSGDPVRLEMPSGDPVACHAHQYGLSGDPVGLKLLSGHPVLLPELFSSGYLQSPILEHIGAFKILRRRKAQGVFCRSSHFPAATATKLWEDLMLAKSPRRGFGNPAVRFLISLQLTSLVK
ncbi:hypothetical protein Y032_0128g1426 [Ancylostoma ceylanicum]|uniref:Uncharacterized protein n=1 Tax=Ancylostoma ceylanicum TaxID=53326 RepID=A0A016T7P6_9BILA|nr:hypothetical protein Y032_0128g1426 [Ancylostoma ceylanicum]